MRSEEEARGSRSGVHRDDVASDYSRRQFVKLGGVAGAGVLMASPLLAACGSSSGGGSTSGGGSGWPAGPDGLDKAPTAAFVPSAKAGPATGLPRRIGVALPDDTELWNSVDAAIKQAVEERGYEHVVSNAGGDIAKHLQQIDALVTRGVGGLISFSIDAEAEKPALLRAIKAGAGVITGVQAPASCQSATNQYAIGKASGTAAADYITQHLGGRAQVVVFNQDKIASLKPAHQGVLDALKAAGPGVQIVADEPLPADAEKTLAASNTILTKNPGANVWIVNDEGILGSLGALRSAGKLDGAALFGTNGLASVIDVIRRGGAIKATQAFANAPITYAFGAFACDWVEGKQIPQVIYAEPFKIDSPASIATFEQGNNDPAGVFKQNGGDYYRLVGNISYATRNRYLTVIAA